MKVNKVWCFFEQSGTFRALVGVFKGALLVPLDSPGR